MKELLLSSGQVEWKAAGFQPGLPTWILKDKRKDFSTADSDSPVTEWFDITVPGGIQYDLFRHSLIPNPYQDMNSLYCEWVEHRWWVCQTCFDKNVILASWEGNNPPSRVELFLEGLDYEADIYLEGILLGAHRGMFHPAVFDITDLFERSTAENGKMHLIIVLKGAPEEQGQYGWTSRTTTQKSRFNYKWDFSTRLVNIGIWKDVKIRLYDEWSLEYPGVWSDHDGNTGKLVMETGVIAHHSDPVIASQPCTLRVECLDPDRKDSRIFREEVVSAAAGERIRMEIHYPDAQPWWPNGHGAQPLVDVRLILICQGRRLDEWTCKTGFRRLEYRHNEGSPSGALPYTYAVNGKRIYAKGVNLVPLDHLYGNLRPEQYEYLVLCMRHANVNLVRVWGGGLVEQDLFYQLCDRYGILVWQEFIQSSSGIENVPAKGKDFLDLLAESARYAVQTLRSHVSLSMWGGGNELMDADRNPANYGDENISMLRDIVKKYDPQRYFLPTSSSGPFFSVFADKPGISHDVHGAWSYRGNPAHYAVYNQSDCLFHGEFGTNGASSVKSLKKFLSPPYLRPASQKECLVWRHHGGHWWNSVERDEKFFGKFPRTQEALGTYTFCSQWVQAEGLRYIIEANRRRKFRNSGEAIWQMNEPWPNIGCTSLTDWFGEAKMAYYWTRKAYESLHPSLRYERLDYPVGSLFNAVPAINNSSDESLQVLLEISVMDMKGQVLYQWMDPVYVPGNAAVLLKPLSFKIIPALTSLFFVRMRIYLDGEAPGQAGAEAEAKAENIYYFSTEKEEYYAGALSQEGAGSRGLDVQVISKARGTDGLPNWGNGFTWLDGANSWEYTCHVTNRSGHVLFHVYPEEQTDFYWMLADRAYETLFPGESREFRILCIPRSAGGFLGEMIPGANDRSVSGNGSPEPEIRFQCIEPIRGGIGE